MAAFFVPGALLIHAYSLLLIFLSACVLVVYMPGIVAALRADELDYVGQLTLGIGLSWAGTLVMRVWVELGRLTHSEGWADSQMVTFYLWLSVVGAYLHLTAPAAVRGDEESRRLLLTIALVGALGLGLGLLIGFYLGGAWK